MSSRTYVLVTPAHNEERFIAQTIECVLAQTCQPQRWAIVSDASTDATDEIIGRYAVHHPLIAFHRLSDPHDRDLGRRIQAVSAGLALLGADEYAYIGTVDADVSFGPTYFTDLISRFEQNPRLGVAGGVIQEACGRNAPLSDGERLRNVANAAQLLRRACHEAIGAYPRLPYGAPDTYVEVTARMLGWDVETFPDLVVHHHRLTASAAGLLRGRFRQGLKDCSFGYHPVFEAFKCARRVKEEPRVLGSVLRMAGFCWAHLRGEAPAVPDAFVRFIRREQVERIRAELGLGSPDSR